MLGRELAQRQGPYEEVGGVLFEGAGLGRMADQGDQFAGGAGGGHLLRRLHAERPYEAVGHGVEAGDDRPEGAGEGVLGAGDEAGHLEGPGDRPVLRDELADDHLDGGGEQHADDDGGAGDGSLGEAGRGERPGQQCGEGGLGEHADHEGGDGDAELGAGELEGQLPQGLDDRTGTAVAVGCGALGVGSLHGDEAELGGHEETVGEDQGESGPEQE